MKKFIRTIFFASGILAFFAISCSGSYILATIENEVKLNKATARGSIRSIVKIGSTLYCSNGEILTKAEFSEDDWTTISSPVSGQCSGLATDGTKLFASFNKYYEGQYGVYVLDRGSWKNVPNSDNIQIVKGSGTVFGSDGSTTYVVTESGFGTKIDGTLNAAGGDYAATSAGLFKKDGKKVPHAPSGICAIDPDGKYFLTGGELTTSNFTEKYAHGISQPSGVALMTITGTEHILVAKNGGYSEIIVDPSDITKSRTVPGGMISGGSLEQYEASVGKYPVKCIYADSNGSGTFYIYLGVNDPHFAKYTGLWGFYSAGKKEWNRE